MKIAIFTDHFLPKSDGVVTRLCATIDYFENLGHELHLYTVEKQQGEYSGAVIHTYPSFRLPFYANRKISVPRFFSILKHLREYKPDILHIMNATLLSLPAYYYSWRHHCPLIGSVHTDYLTYLDYYKMPFLKPVIRQLLLLFCRRNQITLCTSANFQSKLNDLGVARTGIWQKGVDTKHFHPKKYSHLMREYLSQGSVSLPLIIYAGRLSVEKNLFSLLDLITLVPKIRLAVIGDGPLRKRLELEFAGTPTFFAGNLRNEALASAYASADVFIMPSMSETLGLAALEAMAAGCPVVVANAGGLREIVHHGQDGFLFDPQDHLMMIKAVRLLTSDCLLRKQMSIKARKEAEKWDWKESSTGLLEYYNLVRKQFESTYGRKSK